MREADKDTTGAAHGSAFEGASVSSASASSASVSSGSVESAGYPPMPVRTVTVIKVGMAVWAVVLVATLLVPALHEGDRHWWPWTAVAGLVLGLLGYLYVRRGRGNATGVE